MIPGHGYSVYSMPMYTYFNLLVPSVTGRIIFVIAFSSLFDLTVFLQDASSDF